MYTVENFDSAGDFPTRASATLRVLLVEDVVNDAKLIVWQLRKSGFFIRADVVDSLADLERTIRNNPYDVVLSDFALPGFTGMDALATVKKTGVDVPFILVTGSMGEDIAVECMKQGATDYILKDQPENLTRAIQRALNEKDIRDQTARAEEERRKALAVLDLNRELAHAETALRSALEEAESASRAKSEFLSAVSHEMRTPMNAILGMADLLGELQLDSEQRQYVDVLRRAGASLLAIINNVLDLSKIESRHFELERIDFSLEDVIERSLELGALKAREKGLVLLSRIAPGVPLNLIGDPVRLQQVLINLVANSLKFTETGEIVLSVNPHSSGKLGLLEFSVTDSGIGIPPEKLLSIFDDFIQGDTSITRRYGGTGLGLGICRRLIEFMGGKISVESEPGRGSTFLFQAQFEVSAAARISAEVNDFHGRKVLILESSAMNRMIYRETLTAWGLSTTECATAHEGCTCLAQEGHLGRPYSLVILDRQLLDKDGFDAVPMIHAAQPSVPVIMLTNDSRPGEATRCRAAGVAGYAVKPVRRTDLLRLVCEALGQPAESNGSDPASPARPSTAPTLEPLSILIAEDSSDNRLLLRAYLKHTPHQLTFVEDGERAVLEFQKGQLKNAGFDLILMDIQMPLMDGLQATRAIRAYELQQNLKPTAILALTASALAHDVAASSAAGCNAHLSKPISKQKLLAEIDRYSKSSSTAQIPDPILVDVEPEVEELVPEYLAQRKREVAVFEDLLGHSDFDAIRVLAHNMKGNGRSFGFPELTEFGAAMERSARECSATSLSQQLRELVSYLDRVRLKTAP